MLLKLSALFFIIIQNIYSITSDEYLQNYLNSKDSNLIKVDFLIIQHLSIDDIDLKEEWKELPVLSLSNEMLFIKNKPTTLVTLPDIKISNQLSIPKLNITFEDKKQNKENIQPEKPEPFLFERIPFIKEMKKIEDNLNRSKDYRVLYYNSWFQPAFNENMTIPIFIEAYKKGKKVYGEIKIYKERFIHLDAKLRFSKKTNDLEESTMPPKLQNFQTMLDSNKEINVDESSNEDYWIDTIFNTVRLNFKYIEELIYSEEEIMKEEIIKSPAFKYEDLYEIDKDLKLDVNKFNVIDHPYFSVLIKVSEIVK